MLAKFRMRKGVYAEFSSFIGFGGRLRGGAMTAPRQTHGRLAPVQVASYVLAGLTLLLVLKARLVLALFSGLLVYALVHALAPTIERRMHGRQSRMIAVALLAFVVVLGLSLGTWGLHAYLRSDAGNLQTLLKKMADILDVSRSQVPEWVSTYFPADVAALQEMIANWLREHAGEAKILLPEAGHIIVHLLLGMIIGGMVALRDECSPASRKPLARALHQRAANLALMFHKVVFAQVKISFINTVLSAIYLLIVLPLAGVHLPLTKSIVALTFIMGLIPVLGNIVSNTVLVIVALSHSLQVAALSLLYMVAIHKAEYFLNARIIGAQVNARAWELLSAMLLMETLFGVPGVVAAPVFYAYIKKELSDRGLV